MKEPIELRTTQLEQFLQCPFHYKYPKPASKKQGLGTYMHEMIQEYLLDTTDENYDLVKDKISRDNSKELSWLYHWLYLSKSIHQQEKVEVKVTKEIVIDDQPIILSGTIDCVDPDGNISDLKTSQWRWNNFILKDKIQSLVYSWLWEKNKTFTYYVFTKHKKPQLQVLEKEIDYWFCDQKIKEWLKRFIQYNEKDDRECTRRLFCK